MTVPIADHPGRWHVLAQAANDPYLDDRKRDVLLGIALPAGFDRTAVLADLDAVTTAFLDGRTMDGSRLIREMIARYCVRLVDNG